MTFKEHKIQLIDKLKCSTNFHKDDALQRVVEILNAIENSKDLKKQKGLINRISTDSILDWNSINLILEFTNDYSKNLNTMNKEHKKILELIKAYLEKHPDQRFGQALFNLRVIEFKNFENPSESNYEIRDIHNDKDSDVISRIVSQLEWYELQKIVIKAKDSVEGLGGMTVNERLFATGLMDIFDKMRKTNKKYAEYILKALYVDNESIDKILNE